MLARDDWMPREPDDAGPGDAYARAEAWLRNLTVTAMCALVAIACLSTLFT